jgi:hypothetical protein
MQEELHIRDKNFYILSRDILPFQEDDFCINRSSISEKLELEIMRLR